MPGFEEAKPLKKK